MASTALMLPSTCGSLPEKSTVTAAVADGAPAREDVRRLAALAASLRTSTATAIFDRFLADTIVVEKVLGPVSARGTCARKRASSLRSRRANRQRRVLPRGDRSARKFRASGLSPVWQAAICAPKSPSRSRGVRTLASNRLQHVAIHLPPRMIFTGGMRKPSW